MNRVLVKALALFIFSKEKRRKFKHEAYYYFEPLIISRTACLGNFTLDKIDTKKYKVINCAKNRVDYSLSVHDSNKMNCIDLNEVMKYTKDEFKHLFGCYSAQERDVFEHKRVKALIMDSFSELVDQLFVQKDGIRSFCTHYRSIKDTPIVDLYDCYEKLDIEKMENYYIKFFDLIKKTYKDIPIVFIHFPTKFDDRQEFKDRATGIEKIIQRIEESGCYNLVSMKPRVVERNPEDELVYHFSDVTYQDTAEQLVKILRAKGVDVCLKSGEKING